MVTTEGRAAWPSLFICGAALALLAASLYTERWYHWGGIALLLTAWAPWRRFPGNALGVLVALYCAWLFGNALFFTPYYAAESLYQPLMLFFSFAAVAACAGQERLFRAGLILVSLLVLLGMMQYLFGIGYLQLGPFRAAGTFMTANTQGTVIIMFLAPLAALYLARGSRATLAIAVWLFAGLVATESRGAMLALVAGLGFGGLAIAPFASRRILARCVVLVLVGSLAWAAVVNSAQVAAPWARGNHIPAPSASTWLERRAWDRGELYTATLRAIEEHPIAGAGANMFFPAFEARKPDVLRGSDYHYAHSDYLQIWLEFGAVGLILLLLLVGGSLLIALREARRSLDDMRPLVCGSALAACFAHALVDFPLYVPFVLMLCGSFLGALASRHGGAALPERFRLRVTVLGNRVSTTLRSTAAFVVLCWLSQPVLAELAVKRSASLLWRGEARDALYWQSVARRLEPHHAAQYWAEAVILRDQAVLLGNKPLAEEADALFAQGNRENPYEVMNLLSRVRLHRDYPDLLSPAASAQEILEWSKQVVALRPQQATVQAEYARSLAKAGRLDEARQLARRLAKDFPESDTVRRLAREF